MRGEKRVFLEVRGRVSPSLVGGGAPPTRDEANEAGGGKMNFSGSELKLWAVRDVLIQRKKCYILMHDNLV